MATLPSINIKEMLDAADQMSADENRSDWQSSWENVHHPDTDYDTLKEIMQQADIFTLCAIVQHPNTDTDLQLMIYRRSIADFSAESTELLHLSMIMDERCDTAILDRFAESENIEMRSRVAQHQNADQNTLTLLSFDRDIIVSQAATNRLAELNTADDQ